MMLCDRNPPYESAIGLVRTQDEGMVGFNAMHRSEVTSGIPKSGVGQDGSSLRIVAAVGSESYSKEPRIELTVLAEAVKAGVKEALADEDTLIDYPELARRMHLKEKFVRQLKNAGIIHAALDLGKVVRFHWPSVLAELKTSRAGHTGFR